MLGWILEVRSLELSVFHRTAEMAHTIENSVGQNCVAGPTKSG